jgi:hypothetical protein
MTGIKVFEGGGGCGDEVGERGMIRRLGEGSVLFCSGIFWMGVEGGRPVENGREEVFKVGFCLGVLSGETLEERGEFESRGELGEKGGVELFSRVFGFEGGEVGGFGGGQSFSVLGGLEGGFVSEATKSGIAVVEVGVAGGDVVGGCGGEASCRGGDVGAEGGDEGVLVGEFGFGV